MNSYYSSPKYSPEELLEFFPEAEFIVPLKIAELNQEKEELASKMQIFYKSVVLIAEEKKCDDFFVWFWGYAYLKYFYAPIILQIERHIFRLKRISRLINKGENYGNDNIYKWEELKIQAKNTPIYETALPYLEKSRQIGSRVTALCVFHQEKTPSLNFFLQQNLFYCFGCQTHGDVISFKMHVDNLTFKEAVKELTR
jgi:hypothetical protein